MPIVPRGGASGLPQVCLWGCVYLCLPVGIYGYTQG
nr:MAG TPA: hypothetical protein [Caudoviricetes sp.]